MITRMVLVVLGLCPLTALAGEALDLDPDGFFNRAIMRGVLLEDGVPTGLEPRSIKLMEHIIKHYKKLNQTDKAVVGITYTILTGSGDADGIGDVFGRFRKENLPPATYIFYLGNKLEVSRLARLVALVEKKDGIHHICQKLVWNGEEWKEAASVDASQAKAMNVDEVK